MTYLIWYYVITTILFLIAVKDSPVPLVVLVLWPILIPLGLLASFFIGVNQYED